MSDGFPSKHNTPFRYFTSRQSTDGMPIKPVIASECILPFDELKSPLSLIEKLEAYEPKSYLMRYVLLDNAGLSASKVRSYIQLFLTDDNNAWQVWKDALADKKISDKSWPEIAELIYGDMF